MFIAYLLLLAALKATSHIYWDVADQWKNSQRHSRLETIERDLAINKAIVLNTLFYFCLLPLAVQISPSEITERVPEVYFFWAFKIWAICGACLSVVPFLRWCKYFFR